MHRQERTMADISFESRVKAVGLRVQQDGLSMLQAIVEDMDRAAKTVRNERSHAEEPLSALRLVPYTGGLKD
jgi:hypothetical protein